MINSRNRLLNCLLFLGRFAVCSGSTLGMAHLEVNFEALSTGRLEDSLTPK
jgi:hypothetical protein